jgi:hypothetical protein
MKNSMLFFLFFTPFFCFAQFSETFSDGNFTQNPVWTGTTSNFIVNSNNQLQSAAGSSSTSWLLTPSEAIEEASWECKFIIDYPTSSSNYACMYIVSDNQFIENGYKGYFVQVGGNNDEVSLYLQEGMQKIKIIDGIDKRTDVKPLEIKIKVTRDSLSVFRLYSRLSTENDYVLEGTVQNSKVLKSSYFGVSFTNTSTTGTCYAFDDLHVAGSMIIDRVSPEWIGLEVKYPDTIHCVFSEAMNFERLKVKINNKDVAVIHQKTSPDMTNINLTIEKAFEKGMVYQIVMEQLTDQAGNVLEINEKSFAATEKCYPGDVVFNEVMFHQPDSSCEYIEFFNRSGKLIDLSDMIFTTRKTDGSLNSGKSIPKGVILFPYDYVTFTSNPEMIKKYHDCPDDARIIQSEWSSLNNESATIVLTNNLKDTIYDEFTYNVSMHHVFIKNPKGVALERIYPDLPTQDISNWHSAATSNNYGTPGYVNSQFRELVSNNNADQTEFYTESKVFSPDNDGTEDICVLKYQLPEEGYIANLLILSATGEKVLTLASNSLLAASGQCIWDGRNNSGKVANVGIYVIYIEIYHPVIGKRKQIKIPIVLTSR